MGIWFLMFGCNLLFPAIMLIAGRLFMVKPPKEINCIVGYRTEMSMKNENTWLFAHHYAGKLWWKWGKLVLPIAIIPMLFVIGEHEDIIAAVGCVVMCLQMVPLIGVIPPTEKALRKTFDKNGTRKDGMA